MPSHVAGPPGRDTNASGGPRPRARRRHAQRLSSASKPASRHTRAARFTRTTRTPAGLAAIRLLSCRRARAAPRLGEPAPCRARIDAELLEARNDQLVDRGQVLAKQRARRWTAVRGQIDVGVV